MDVTNCFGEYMQRHYCSQCGFSGDLILPTYSASGDLQEYQCPVCLCKVKMLGEFKNAFGIITKYKNTDKWSWFISIFGIIFLGSFTGNIIKGPDPFIIIWIISGGISFYSYGKYRSAIDYNKWLSDRILHFSKTGEYRDLITGKMKTDASRVKTDLADILYYPE